MGLRRTKLMSYYKVSNLDIKMIYISNENSDDGGWRINLFNMLLFFADSRVKKANIFYDKDDFTQEAYLGLWDAICTFDHHKNFDFYRWAQWNISSRLRNLLSLKSRADGYNLLGSGEEGFYEINDDEVFIKLSLSDHYKVLDERERGVLHDIFFLGKTLSEVGNGLLLSTERIRQIKFGAIEKLKSIYV